MVQGERRWCGGNKKAAWSSTLEAVSSRLLVRSDNDSVMMQLKKLHRVQIMSEVRC